MTCRLLLIHALALLALGAAAAPPTERTERFDRDPAWEGVNHRSRMERRTIRQDFGYSRTAHAGGQPGEVGGFIQPAAESAYYARRLPRRTFADVLTASGSVALPGRESHVLIAFFNHRTLNEWRTPNTVALRLSARGDFCYVWLEYCTSRWRAGGDSPQGFTVPDAATGRQKLIEFPARAAVHRWSLRYDPHANGGAGAVTATFNDRSAVCHLDAGHKADGAVFDRFGLLPVIKSADGGGEVWLDDVTVNGETERFDRDPGWEASGNRRTYVTEAVRPRFDFGFSPTRFAGGRAAGELGGRVYRGDGRYADKMAWYADRLAPLTLDKPLRATGKVCLRRGVSDSTTLLGFFSARQSAAVSPAQNTGFPDPFFGIAVEGPSSEGFFLYPAYRMNDREQHLARAPSPNRIYPDDKAHDWSLDYSPEAGGGNGQVRVRLDRNVVTLDLRPGDRTAGGRFDRFGLITTRIDGNGQMVYFDDLTYTTRQE